MINSRFALCFWFVGFVLSNASYAIGNLDPARIYLAELKKKNTYIPEGLITGGDRRIEKTTVKDIRRANSAGFERIVIDLETSSEKKVAFAQSELPYFQVDIDKTNELMTVSLWGKPVLKFENSKVVSNFEKSRNVQSLDLLPRIDDEVWTFGIKLRQSRMVEVFELVEPPRLIIDIKNSAVGHSEVAGIESDSHAEASAKKSKSAKSHSAPKAHSTTHH